MLRKRTRAGFTLIELMVVVAIIGVLAAVAITAFIDYIRKSKQSEVNELLDRCYKGVLDYYDKPHGRITGTTVSSAMPPNMLSPIGPAYAGGDTCDPVALTGESGFIPSATFSVGPQADILNGLKWVFTEAVIGCYFFRNDTPLAVPATGDRFYCEAWTDIDDDDIPAHFWKQGTYSALVNSFQGGHVWHDDATDEY
jgi:prepilin-type N-terminal cleavage/methylation domain-containing protein